MKKFGSHVVTILIGVIVGVLFAMQYYAASEFIEKKEGEISSVKWRVNHFKLSDENLFNELVAQGVEYPEIVTAQAILETDNFKSAACLQDNNLFGLRYKDGRYMHFDHWTDAVTAYKKYIQKWDSKPPNYYEYINALDYAGDTSYIAKLKELVRHRKR